ncbi:CLUMA_CG012682, isoform A [Clunio marinus]|uniref:CLUMA_CG012682, isoform A n=1 Tax=Clunio marinus TaxID=568069 RepID=A0A1J1ILE5_9DIPT|nr:CLUMA_CG012682, isoform A [Clunio marinus]
MNEIDNSNGNVTTDNREQEIPLNENKSPLLSSLLSSARQESFSNGQQSKISFKRNDFCLMDPATIEPSLQHDENIAFMTKKTTVQQQKSEPPSNESGQTTTAVHRNFNNLNDLLQRNNNNNKSSSTGETTTSKSILENCLLKPSSLKNQRLESQKLFPKMEESEYQQHHHHHLSHSHNIVNVSPSTSASKISQQSSEDSRKVEPLKISLNRDHVRAVIKFPQTQTYDSLSKTSLRQLHVSDENEKNINQSSTSPTHSPSSSLSSESSFDNCNNDSTSTNNSKRHSSSSSMQVIPKVHIRSFLDGTLNHEQSELHIVPKLTITGLNSPQSNINNEQQQISHNNQQQSSNNDHCTMMNSTIEASPVIPKITIKKDNHTSDYHLNTDTTNIIPKRLTNKANSQTKESGGKFTIKAFSEPHVPKLTIKTTNNSDTSDMISVIEHQQHSISKKTQQMSPTKLTIKPILCGSGEQKYSTPKITLKAVNNSETTYEKIVPKIVVKLPKDSSSENKTEGGNDFVCNVVSSPPSPSSAPPSQIPTLNIKPILPPPSKDEKDVIVDVQSPSEENNFSVVNKVVESSSSSEPLEINTTSSVMINTDSGQDSPRIILKINKANSDNSLTSEIVPHPSTDIVQRSQVANNKRKKNSSNPEMFMFRNLRQSRRSNESSSKSVEQQEKRQKNADKSQPVKAIDPLSLSNDAITNSKSVDELVTPKRGRGRPKKVIVENVTINSTINPIESSETPSLEKLSQGSLAESSVDGNKDEKDLEKKKSGRRGRKRGVRGKRIVEIIKNGKPIQITLEGHDDDDSPSFSLYNRSLKDKVGSNRKHRGGGKSSRAKGKLSHFLTPERSKNGPFMTPNNEQNNRRKLFNTPSNIDEDTRMSIGGGDSSQQASLFKSAELQSCEESQSSMISSASNTVEGSSKKRSKKMEVCEPEGRTEFTIDLLAEYDWPQTEQVRSRETFMIQEQIAEYLGVKSFKRKYPDLMRRPVDMEERNYLFENGFASEKMCDLGLTAVFANEILDIMCNDYPDKYEEYKRYQREKAFKFARIRLETAAVDRSQMKKDKAISSASEWNTKFNKDRRSNRRCCMDLQNFLIQKPTPIRHYKTKPSVKNQSHYPIAMVPGQFSEYYEKYTSLQLSCYPLNTTLIDQNKLESYLAIHSTSFEPSEESDSSDSDDEAEGDNQNSSSTDSDTSSSTCTTDDEFEDPICCMCLTTQFVNCFQQPEKFIKCSTCKNQAHPSCIQMSSRMYFRSLAYKWQCSNCKTCSKCQKRKDNKMLYCIQCDRGFHIYCLGLRNIPEGQYHCDKCNICSECGAKSPEGHFNSTLTQQQRQELAMIAQWNYDVVINPLTNISEHLSSFCLPCFRKCRTTN